MFHLDAQVGGERADGYGAVCGEEAAVVDVAAGRGLDRGLLAGNVVP